jgi:MoxR-like ATPase
MTEFEKEHIKESSPYTKLQARTEQLKAEIGYVVVGQTEVMEWMLIALLTRGHILLEGVPGIAKTTLAKLFAAALGADFSRIQFTPDLMPSDIIGTNIFNQKSTDFEFRKGPLFTNLVLTDEVNRAPAKTQAALFEVMQERQITVDGSTYKLNEPFMVLATQNPIDQEGTYRLPEAQLDRFLFKIVLKYPNQEEEIEILNRFRENFNVEEDCKMKVIFSTKEILKAFHLVEQVHIDPSLLEYIAKMVHQTRNHGSIMLGASPRASLAIMKASKALAAISGRNYVIPDDIRSTALPVLNHRIILSPEKEMDGVETVQIVNEIIQHLEVPR